ncbi:uncharacterized protein LOC143913743 [Arctopsyche grandis]|uniref:uncharacterized protein LOC143913743 n=1 Tax=Arctopsyche grandis TaxID=121162 RepID=UPI00406D6A36
METAYNSDDTSSNSDLSWRTNRKTIHPSRYAHILAMRRTKDDEEDSNVITVCSIQDYRNSMVSETHSGDDNYLVSYPDDDSDLCSILADNVSSIRTSIYSVKSVGDDLYTRLCPVVLGVDSVKEVEESREIRVEVTVDGKLEENSVADDAAAESHGECEESENLVNVQCPLVFLDTGRAATILRDLKWSGYKKV